MTLIKTVTFLIKCLKVDIPIFRDFQKVSVRINRVMLYKASLIELLTLVADNQLYIMLSREHADMIIQAYADAAKAKASFVATVPVATHTGEPEYELVPDPEHDSTGTLSDSSVADYVHEQVAAI